MIFLFTLLSALLLSAAYFRIPKEGSSFLAFELMLFFTLVFFAAFYRTFSQKSAKHISEEKARQFVQEADRISGAWKEARSRIPKNNPRRESDVVLSGMNRLSAVRSMAVLLRSTPLRERVMEICDIADSVLETIRRMPNDTPAAVVFADKHLASLYDTLESSFKASGAKGKKAPSESSAAEEMEPFNPFISIFCKQQESILSEGKAVNV